MNGFDGNFWIFGKLVIASPDSEIDFGRILAFEGWEAIKESVENDADCPDIYLKVISSAFEDFGGNVVGSATNRPFIFL